MAAKGQPKSGGRDKGTPNKRSEEAIQVFERRRFDPLQRMITLAHGYERTIREIDALDKKHPGAKLDRIDAYITAMGQLFPIYKELLQYRYPKRKAIEISGDETEPIVVRHLWGAPPGQLEESDDGGDNPAV